MLGYWTIRYALPVLFPFLLGFLIAFALKPVIRKLSELLHIRRRFCAIPVILGVYVLLGGILWVMGRWLTGQLSLLLTELPMRFSRDLLPMMEQGVQSACDRLSSMTGLSSRQVMEFLGGRLPELTRGASSFFMDILSGMVKSLPTLAAGLVIAILSSVFISLDYTAILRFLMGQLSPRLQNVVRELRDFLVNTALRLVKAYLILMAITFCYLSVGFFFLRIPNALSRAFFISLADFLPLIGAGIILVPWGVFLLMEGNYPLGFAILLLYAVLAILRSFIEPKIVGSQVGLHPFVTLCSMVLGGRIFGFWGMFLLPFLVLIAKMLNDTGKLHLWTYP